MKFLKQNLYLRYGAIISAILVIELLISAPAFAHHPLDGRLPVNLFEGLLSGFGHPVIGFDHLAFVIASGLIALGIVDGIIVPLTFVIATTIGVGIHLASIDLPLPEIFIAASVVMFGILLIFRSKKRQNSNYTLKVSLIAAFAGLFHGFAYGEGIFGAETTPLLAYLIGFTLIQLVISLGTYFFATKLSKKISLKYITRLSGLAIASTGMVFLSSAMLIDW